MRTEREMTALILGVAERDARVRAVFMNGSRANPNAPRDIFQDYDIVYVVEETASFRRSRAGSTCLGSGSSCRRPTRWTMRRDSPQTLRAVMVI